MKKNITKVFVGMSGGVDSSVSAALLQKQGYDVTGVFIKVWQPDWMKCTWREDRQDAMRVCAHLGIPFSTLDLEKNYKKEVVDYMIREYSEGRTPNPDVMCNMHVKFGGFLDWAKKHDADFIATGHYAQVEKTRDSYILCESADNAKDQTYFLWTLSQKQLASVLFPVGHLTKPQVRKLAQKFALPNAAKKDSQGLCFIGKVDLKEFLSHYIEKKEGNVIDEAGNILGTHEGAFFYTIGQRHGFHKNANVSTLDKPLYITAKNIQENTITVSEKVDSSAFSVGNLGPRSIFLKKIHWISDLPPISNTIPEKKYLGRIRYRQTLQPCVVTKNLITEGWKVTFDTPQEGVSNGQSLVLYDEERHCLGGGIIV